MRMNDYEYEFVQDSIEKKGTARSARNARTHCGKSGAVRLPSDFKTKKEIKAMSGEVITYASLKKPMTWEDFKKLPNDLKKEYITWIREKFGAPDSHIATMLGISGATLGLYFKDLKLSMGKGSGNNRKWEKEKFYAWSHGVDENLVEGTAEIEEEETPACEEVTYTTDTYDPTHGEGIDIPAEEDPVQSNMTVIAPVTCVPVIPKQGSMTFERNDVDDILQTVRALLSGGGVKINCTVTWEVVETSDGR